MHAASLIRYVFHNCRAARRKKLGIEAQTLVCRPAHGSPTSEPRIKHSSAIGNPSLSLLPRHCGCKTWGRIEAKVPEHLAEPKRNRVRRTREAGASAAGDGHVTSPSWEAIAKPAGGDTHGGGEERDS